MTEAERQQVIDALEYACKFASGFESDEADNAWLKIGDAIAIMRREREPAAWHDEEMDAAYTASELDGGVADGLIPLYKD